MAVIAIGGIGDRAAPGQSGPTPAPKRSEATAWNYGPVPAALAAFYRPPAALAAAAPGTLFAEQKLAAPEYHGSAYRVSYASRSLKGRPVSVTGMIIVPEVPAPAAGYPVLSWAHGTNGMGDACAPSLYPASAAPPNANDLLDQGVEIVATDYEGEGTSGDLPYLAGASAAHNTIDIVRAARDLPEAHASSDYVVWGYSEGGQAAMFSLDVARTYAPELHLKGDVAGGAPSQFEHLYSVLKRTSAGYYLLMVAIGLNQAYGNQALPLDQLLTPAGMALVPKLERVCIGYFVAAELGQISIDRTVKADPFTIAAWRKVLEANDPQYLRNASTAPLLLVQGGTDDIVPTASTASLAKHECAIGQHTELWDYPRLDHSWALVGSAPDVVQWIGDRFAGSTASDPPASGAKYAAQKTVCTGS